MLLNSQYIDSKLIVNTDQYSQIFRRPSLAGGTMKKRNTSMSNGHFILARMDTLDAAATLKL